MTVLRGKRSGDILATGSPDDQEWMGTIALYDLPAPNPTLGNYGERAKRKLVITTGTKRRLIAHKQLECQCETNEWGEEFTITETKVEQEC